MVNGKLTNIKGLSGKMSNSPVRVTWDEILNKPSYDNADTALEALTECGVITPLANKNNVVYTSNDDKIYIL